MVSVYLFDILTEVTAYPAPAVINLSVNISKQCLKSLAKTLISAICSNKLFSEVSVLTATNINLTVEHWQATTVTCYLTGF